jgi:hypothetical protein
MGLIQGRSHYVRSTGNHRHLYQLHRAWKLDRNARSHRHWCGHRIDSGAAEARPRAQRQITNKKAAQRRSLGAAIFSLQLALQSGLKCGFRLAKMTALGIALIVAGLTLLCGSMIFRLFTRQKPAFSRDSFEQGLFRVNDEMWREPDKL